jgi:amidase
MGNTFSGPELCRMSATEVVGLLRDGEVSPQEAVEASLARIEQVEPAVNAMVTTCPERARNAAAQIQPQDKDNWLGGLPVGIKDLNQVAGVRTTFGTPSMADFIPEESDGVVTRIEANGGIVVGKTNTPEMGAGANTFNAVFGRTRNPWNTSLNAGGSSGGAAVSLATGEVWLSQGSDLAGSLRTPAAYCGIVGMRPSPGLVPGGSGMNKFNTEGVNGPMARSVEDCALFLDALAGYDAADPLSFPPNGNYRDAVLRADEKVRIAYSRDLNGFSITSDQMDAALRDALQKVAAQGGTIDEACPDLPELDRTYRVLRAMLWAAGPGRMPQHVQDGFKQTLTENIAFGQNLTVDDVYDAQINRSRLYQNVEVFLRDFDVLAFPVVGLMPGPVEVEYPTEIDGKPLGDYVEWLKYSYLSTTTSMPSISVPVGLSDDGMPIGLQLLGRPRGEARLLQVARAVEMAVGISPAPIDPVVTHQA